MPEFVVTSPDGRKFRVTAPEGATQADAIAYVQRQQQAEPEPAPDRPAITGPYVPFVDDTGMRAPQPRVGAVPGLGQAAAVPPEALQAASVGATVPAEPDAPEYARSTRQAMKESVATLPLLAVGGKAMEAPKMLGRMLRGTVAAGGGGGLYGIATGEGDAKERLERGLTFGTTGAALGFAAPPVVAGMTGGGRAAGNLVSRLWRGKEGRTSVAARQWADIIRSQFPNLTPEEALARAERRVQRYGPDAAVLDTGRRARQFAADTARSGGAPGTTIDEFLLHRQAGRLAPSGRVRGGQVERVSGLVEDASGPRRSGVKAMRQLRVEQGRASTPLYERTANDPANVVTTEGFAKARSNPITDEMVTKIKADAKNFIEINGERIAMADLPDNSLPVIDEVQKQLSDKAGTLYRKGAKHQAGKYVAARRALVEAADEAFPDYAKARDVWRDFKGVEDADDLGRKFMRGDVDVLEDAVSRMKPEELAQFRAGAAKTLKDTAAKTKGGGDVVNKLFGTEDARQRARIAFGSDYRKAVPRIVGESEKFKSFQEAFGNSLTAERIARMQRLGIDPEELAAAGLDIATGNKIGLLYRLGRMLRSPGLAGPPEAVRSEAARIGVGRDFGPIRKGMGAAQRAQTNRRALEKAALAGGLARQRGQ